ncbi:hypothetical protein BDR04DRAFT_1123806, partial [Suillus decipiens]
MSGNKAVLHEQLEEFSCNCEAWDRLKPGAHKAHKGPQLLGLTVSGTMDTNVSQSKDTWTAPEIRALLSWADAITSMYPYELTDGIPLPASAPNPPALTSHSTAQPSTADALLEEAIVQNGVINTTVASHQQHPLAVEQGSSNKLRVLNLRDGTILQLADDNIPDPPAVSFANDIPHLNVMWDDCSMHWLNESVFAIQGHHIAIKYWPSLYHYGYNQQWKGTKHKWSGWW